MTETKAQIEGRIEAFEFFKSQLETYVGDSEQVSLRWLKKASEKKREEIRREVWTDLVEDLEGYIQKQREELIVS